MDLRQHEKWIKQELEGAKNSVDSNALWADLSAHVPKKKDNRKLIFFLLFGFFIVGTITYFSIDFNDTSTSIETNNVNQQIVDKNNLENNSKSEMQLETNIPTDDKRLATKANIKTQEVNSSDSKSIFNKEKSSNKLIGEQFVTVESRNYLEKNSVNNQSTINSILDDPKKSNTLFISEEGRKNQTELDKGEIILETREAITFSFVESSKLTTLENKYYLGCGGILLPIERNNRNNWIFGMAHGLNQSRETYEINGMESQTKIEDISSSVPGYSGMIYANYKLNTSWKIEGGLQYNQYVNRLRHDYEYRVLNEELGIKEIFIGTDGATTEVEGSIQTFDVEEGIGTWYQTEHNILASLGINYQVFSWRRFRGQLGVGITSNIMRTFSGSSLINQDERFIVGQANSSIQYPLDINPYGMICLEYLVFDNTTLGIQVRYNRNKQLLNNINQSSNLIRNTYNIGLSCSQTISL